MKNRAAICMAACLFTVGAGCIPAAEISVCADTYGQLEYNALANRVIITGCDKHAVQVDIPASINGLPVTSIRKGAFYKCTELSSVSIPDSVIVIEDAIFEYCNSLREIKVSADNLYYQDVNGVLFSKNKKKLIKYPAQKQDASFSVPDGVTEVCYAAFEECTALASVNLPSSVEKIASTAFFCCPALTAVTVPENTAELAWGAFLNCEGLNSVTILNPACKINDAECTISNHYDKNTEGFRFSGTISGYEGSTAQEYAQKHNYAFVSLGKAPAPENLPPDPEVGSGDKDKQDPDNTGVPYDVNLDGDVSVSDAIIIARIVAEDQTLQTTAAMISAADVNKNGHITADDTILLLREIAGM